MLMTIIGVVIGLSFVYLLLSFLATWVQELIATAFQLRSRELIKMVQNLLDPSLEKPQGIKKLREEWKEGVGVLNKLKANLPKALYEHPLINGLAKGARMPSYIPSREFGAAVFDILARAGNEASGALQGFEAFKRGVSEIGNDGIRGILQSFLSVAEEKAGEAAKKGVEVRERITQWFDAAMQRVSGWYKRKAQIIAIAIGITFAVSLNVDSLKLANSLLREPKFRDAVNAAAAKYIQKDQSDEEKKVQSALNALDSLPLPMGWEGIDAEEFKFPNLLLRILGWILTGIAISQGAPIWFDVLNTFINLRGSGKAPETSSPKKSGNGSGEE